jgi:hypothetical protein
MFDFKDQVPILQNTIFPILHIHICNMFSQICMCHFYSFVKNPSYQVCISICKPRLVYFTSNLQNNWLKMIVKKLSCEKILIISYKYVNSVSYFNFW